VEMLQIETEEKAKACYASLGGDLGLLRLIDSLYTPEIGKMREYARLRTEFYLQVMRPLRKLNGDLTIGSKQKEFLTLFMQSMKGHQELVSTRRGALPDAKAEFRKEWDEDTIANNDGFATKLKEEYRLMRKHPDGQALSKMPAASYQAPYTKDSLNNVVAMPELAPIYQGDMAGLMRLLVKEGAVESWQELRRLCKEGQHRFFRQTHMDKPLEKTRGLLLYGPMVVLIARARNIAKRAEVIMERLLPKGMDFHQAPTKGFERMRDKVLEYAKEDDIDMKENNERVWSLSRNIIDILRAALAFQTMEELPPLMKKIESWTLEREGVTWIRRKNGYNEGVEMTGGFRDIKFNLLIDVDAAESGGSRQGTRFFYELSVIYAPFLKLKKNSHLDYRAARGDYEIKCKARERQEELEAEAAAAGKGAPAPAPEAGRRRARGRRGR